LGDVRLTTYQWVVDPAKMPKGNLQFTAALKLWRNGMPKGCSIKMIQHWFWARLINPLQLGDGGTGLPGEGVDTVPIIFKAF